MKHIAIAVVLTACTASTLAETNYCHDPAATASWERIKRKHRGERDIEAVAALRERLCREVDVGAMSVREATEKFEAEAGAGHRGSAEAQPPARGRGLGARLNHFAIERPLKRS